MSTIAGLAKPPLAGAPGIGSAQAAPETAAHRKLAKAAREFEGILIAQLMGDFKMGASSLAGDAPLAGADTLNTLAIQSLSSALASRGGLGIAQMLVHKLGPSLDGGK